MEVLSGIGVSRGISIAPVFHFRSVSLVFETYHVEDAQTELARYQEACQVTLEKLEAIFNKAVAEIGTDEASIFHAHMTILQDPDMNDGIQTKILDEKLNAETAVFEVSESYCRLLEEINDDYIKARVLDIRDVRNSILRVLLKVCDEPGKLLGKPSIVISRDLTPSDCLSLDRRMIQGFCTVEGGTTSHTAILSRSLGVPAIVGVPESVLHLEENQPVILDGYNGSIIIQPDEAAIAHYESMRGAKKAALQQALSEAHLPAVTLDGASIEVYANIGSDSAEDLQVAVKNGAEGVGLLRTEFIYLDCTEMPGEELQYQKYSAVVEAFGDKPVILRTLDIGGDKQLPYLELPYELNPFLGVRGLRLCLRNVPLFKTQLRAALRAGSKGRLQIMFPMVTKASEINQARQILEECRQELLAEGKAIAEHMEVGIMIEIPAAAILSHQLASEVDFFSIGTNDLTQYTMAVDRTNNTLSDLANAYDPAVLQLIHSVAEGAHQYGKKAGVCGELAGEPLAIPILVGLGIDELSMNPPVVPLAKQIIRRLNKEEAKRVAEEVLELETPADVKQIVLRHFPFLKEIIG